ncbi:acetyl-CoA carboxylase carboxyltransferase subunit beta [Desemzia sp. RIT804]|uniref:acetyl-CoA carboxylase, carboxyltransferase subunit beta n=1 Tax=Desemzia sp. RIT 804 TaxID=2810209 RepID=UPI0019516CCD|nr:acetyl-CoA carboxylase, carboxyltransferase subunit beta [Desemzia sp. RIT 804]MBM6613938.1 acetyl-CoA carboxylase carboxyltransferase subunit beta [Desemzia sp. RIT 804]
MKLFKKKRVYIPIHVDRTQPEDTAAPVVPDGMFTKCPQCHKSIYTKDLGHDKICPECGYSFRICATERIRLIADEGSFEEWDKEMEHSNPLDFPGYEEKWQQVQAKSGLNEAVVTGKAEVNGHNTVICVMDSTFIMGSMGHIVGEKITLAVERATEEELPVIIFTASGGARMQEGIISLMQMAKVSGALARHSESGLLYITVLTDPTTGGVTASFAMQGDIILSEPRALVGFAGRRVIEQTIKETLPNDFQLAESVLENGFIDKIVPRSELKQMLGSLLKLHE